MSARTTASKPALRFEGLGLKSDRNERVAVEEPLEIRIGGEPFAVTMRTPGHDHELCAGLLLSEGIIQSRDDLGGIAHCGRPDQAGYGNTLEVTAAPGARLDLDRAALARRGTVTTSACGVCGRRSIDDLLSRIRPIETDIRFSPAMIASLTEKLRATQKLFDETGGVHAAAAATPDGEIFLVREDVGRHNAVDKLVGRLLLDAALPARDRVLVASGRVSFEIVQKALVACFSAVVAVSAPTTLAIETALSAGILLVGFSRGDRMTVYAGAERLSVNG
jgi:FdhD protein